MYDGTLDTGIIPFKMCCAAVALDQYLPGWNLASIEETAKPQLRRFVYEVNFDNSFSNVPLVHIGVTGFDIDNKDTSRLSVRAEEITHSGFNVVVETWMHTRMYKVEFSWLAIGTE